MNDDIFIMFEDGFEIKPKYYSFNRFLVLTRVLSLQDVFLRNIFYFVFIKLSSGQGWSGCIDYARSVS